MQCVSPNFALLEGTAHWDKALYLAGTSWTTDLFSSFTPILPHITHFLLLFLSV
jgi:hypothetical protein